MNARRGYAVSSRKDDYGEFRANLQYCGTRGVNCKKFEISDYGKFIKEIREDGWINDAKRWILAAYDYRNGWDYPPEKPALNQNLLDKLQLDSYDPETQKFDWKLASRIISESLLLKYLPTTKEFLFYEPQKGYWRDGGTDLIQVILRKAFRGTITKHAVEEVLADLKGFHTDMEFFPDHRPLVNLQNGVFDLIEGKLIRHSPDFNFRYVLPIRFNRRAVPEKILHFLEEITADEKKKALKILEAYAYCLLPGYPIQKAIALVGRGNNGKSVALQILASLLGKENVSGIPLQTIGSSRFAAAELRGKLANISGDVGGGFMNDTALFKQLTGGDFISAELKGVQKRPHFENRAKLIFAFNRLPQSSDLSMAYFRRFELIELTQDFSGKEDRKIIEKLTTSEELSGLFNLLVSIFVPTLMKRGDFYESMDVNDIQVRYELASDPSLAFIHEQVEADPEGQVLVEELYQKYTAWCRKKGLSPTTEHSFGNTLRNRSGLLVQKRRIQVRGVQKNYYVGIRHVETVEPQNLDQKLDDHDIYSLLSDYINSELSKHILGFNSISCISYISLREIKMHVKGDKKENKDSAKHMQVIQHVQPSEHVLVRVHQNIEVAWDPKPYYLRKNDIVHIDRRLFGILSKRGIVSEIHRGGNQ